MLLAPVVVALPSLLGWVLADPLYYTAAVAHDVRPGWLPGVPYIDPNNGFQTQALGYRAALDWLSGQVPWWNPYSGVGMPLAAEYQPAAMSPFTLLLLLPDGAVWHQVMFQVLAGLGTYGLLRQLGLARLAATTGALLFAFNGTLAWFAHGPATAVPWLPWMLWGVDRAFASSSEARGGGWRLLAAAMALALLSGFPETAYLGGLLALAWAVVRGLQCPSAHRMAYAARITVGGLVGIAIAAPQLLAFFHLLSLAHLGGHGERFAHEALSQAAVLPSLVAPYVLGPPFAYSAGRLDVFVAWSGIGGYATLALLAMAAYGFCAWRGPIRWLLLAWILLALGKTFGLEPAVSVLNLVPGVTLAAFYRYAPPSWTLALVILAAAGIDAMARGDRTRAGTAAAAVVVALGLAALVHFGAALREVIVESVRERNWALGSAAWALATATAVAWMARPASRARAALCALLVVEAMVFYAIPTMSNPRAARVDEASLRFLQDNLGFQRFFSLGPIAPNYGARFGIASINHNYLPVPRRWTDWVHAHLDAAPNDPVIFNGARIDGKPSSADELRRNLAMYERAAVRYVVAPPGHDPFAALRARAPAPEKVHAGAAMDIFELAQPAAYVATRGGRCDLVAESRTRLLARCDAPATLVRRELFFPGWTVRIAGEPAALSEHEGLFQAVELPAGRSEVRFRYAPPYVEWAWLTTLAAVLLFIGLRFPRARRPAARAGPATPRGA